MTDGVYSEGDGGLIELAQFVEGEGKSLVVVIGNHEHQPVNYSIVVELQEVRIENSSANAVNDSEGGNISVIVEREVELRRFQTRVAHNETWNL